MNFLKSLFKPASRYKISKYPTSSGYEYAAFYKEHGVWWSINRFGTTSVSEDSIMGRGPFHSTYEEAGAAVNRHATNGGSETVWEG